MRKAVRTEKQAKDQWGRWRRGGQLLGRTRQGVFLGLANRKLAEPAARAAWENSSPRSQAVCSLHSFGGILVFLTMTQCGCSHLLLAVAVLRELWPLVLLQPSSSAPRVPSRKATQAGLWPGRQRQASGENHAGAFFSQGV